MQGVPHLLPTPCFPGRELRAELPEPVAIAPLLTSEKFFCSSHDECYTEQVGVNYLHKARGISDLCSNAPLSTLLSALESEFS